MSNRLCLLVLLPAALAATLSAAPFVPAKNANSAAFSPDGTLAVTGRSGMTNSEFPPRPHPQPSKCGQVAVYDVATGERLHRWETFGDVTKVAFSPDGKLVAAARLYASADGVRLDEVTLWDVDSGQEVRALSRCRHFTFSPDGRRIAVLTSRHCQVFELPAWEKGPRIEPLAGAVVVEFSPDGESLAGIVEEEGKCRVEICSLGGETLARSPAFEAPFYSIAFSPDGKSVATGHPAGNVLVWKTVGLEPLARFRSGGEGRQRVFYSPDGEILAAGDQRTGDVVMWDADGGEELRRFSLERGGFHTYMNRQEGERIRPEEDPYRFAFSPDGSAFLAACYGGMIRLVSSGQTVRELE